jgi:hypothetical protein
MFLVGVRRRRSCRSRNRRRRAGQGYPPTERSQAWLFSISRRAEKETPTSGLSSAAIPRGRVLMIYNGAEFPSGTRASPKTRLRYLGLIEERAALVDQYSRQLRLDEQIRSCCGTPRIQCALCPKADKPSRAGSWTITAPYASSPLVSAACSSLALRSPPSRCRERGATPRSVALSESKLLAVSRETTRPPPTRQAPLRRVAPRRIPARD